MKEFVEYKIISNWVIKMRAAEIRFIKCARNLSYLNQRQRRLENVIAKLKKDNNNNNNNCIQKTRILTNYRLKAESLSLITNKRTRNSKT